MHKYANKSIPKSNFKLALVLNLISSTYITKCVLKNCNLLTLYIPTVTMYITIKLINSSQYIYT